MSQGQDLVDNMERVWRSIEDLCRDLTEEEWKTATDCPGWSVQDQLSHLAGSESGILGRPSPDHTPRDTSYVKNDIGRRNEAVVDYRRPSPGQRVLVLQRQFREGCGVMPAWRRGAWHGSVWPVRYCPAYPQATAATRLARTVPGAAFPAPPGRPAAS